MASNCQSLGVAGTPSREENYSKFPARSPEFPEVLHIVPKDQVAVGPKGSTKEGYLQMFERYHKTKQYILKEGYTILSTSGLCFKNVKVEDKTAENWQLDVKFIEIVEDVEYTKFGKHSFQVGNSQKLIYFCAKNESERREWKKELRGVVRLSKNEMLGEYHPGVFQYSPLEKWSCCEDTSVHSSGCCPTSQIDGAYYKCTTKYRPLFQHSNKGFLMMPHRGREYDITFKQHSTKKESPATTSRNSNPQNESYVIFQKTDSQFSLPNECPQNFGYETRSGMV